MGCMPLLHLERLVLRCILPLLLIASVWSQEDWKYADLKSCEETGGFASSDPCVRYNLQPTNSTTVVTLVQVTDWECDQARDGPSISVPLLNQENDGRGAAIGFYEDVFVQFRLVSVVAGDFDTLDQNTYNERHQSLLNSMVQDLQPHFILGSCTKLASNEPQIALETSTMLLAQVGPPSFYRDDNPWLFGVHVSSDEYTVDATHRLKFWMDHERRSPSSLPVRVIYRNESEFFYSTCNTAVQNLKKLGFEDTMDIVYHAAGDEDQDGIVNSIDPKFLEPIADQACPPVFTTPDTHGFHPAFFFCTGTEQDVILKRMRENGCLPSSIWLTASTWRWATENADSVHHFQGGGQWHPALGYSDRFFTSGTALLSLNNETNGYYGGYDLVISYSLPVMLSNYLQSVYRIFDSPDFIGDMQDTTRREVMRREMVNLKTNVLFGPIAFDKDQRNSGREAAASQWQKKEDRATNTTTMELVLVSPISHAQASAVVPALSAGECPPGEHTDTVLIRTESSILTSKCSPCPVNTFSPAPSRVLTCTACPEGTSSELGTGAKTCVRYEDNIIGTGLIGFGMASLVITWLLAFGFMFWCFQNRTDSIVRMAQPEYLFLICVGAIISSSSLFGLSFQAYHDEDTETATRACQTIPFLYTVGWVLQYASLSAKTYRLSMVVNAVNVSRVKSTTWSGCWIILASLAIDLIIVIAWSALAPLEYVRDETSVSLLESESVVVVESAGHCRMSADVSIWVFLGPLLANHTILVVGTHWLLNRVSTVDRRYQEKQYIGMASVLVLQVALIGIPVLVAAGDSVESTYIILTSVVTVDNVGVLCLIFGPKVHFQRKGLDEGVNITESILRKSHENAKHRERIRANGESHPNFDSECSQSTPAMDSRMKSSMPLSSISESSMPMSSTNSEAAVNAYSRTSQADTVVARMVAPGENNGAS